jgi:hypothetical protein
MTKAVVHRRQCSVSTDVRGQTVRTWLISPETLVGHLLSQRALAIRTLSHLLRTGRTRLGRRHPRRLLRGLAECASADCVQTTPNSPNHPPKHTCVQRGAQTAYKHVQQHQIRPQTARQAKRATPYAPPHSPWMTRSWVGTLCVRTLTQNFYVDCVSLCQFACVNFVLFAYVSVCVSSWCLMLCLRSNHGHVRACGADDVIPSGAGDSQLCQGSWPDPCDTRGVHHTAWRSAVHKATLHTSDVSEVATHQMLYLLAPATHRSEGYWLRCEQMRDSSKLGRDTRAAVNQDRLDTIDEMTAEEYTIIAPDGTQHFTNTVFGKIQRFYHHQLMAFGIRKPLPPPPTGAASCPPQSETTKFADLPLHTFVSLCALLAVLHHVHNTRLFFFYLTRTTHTHVPLHHTTSYSHPPTTHSHIVHESRSRTDAGHWGAVVGAPWPVVASVQVSMSCTRRRCPSSRQSTCSWTPTATCSMCQSSTVTLL